MEDPPNGEVQTDCHECTSSSTSGSSRLGVKTRHWIIGVPKFKTYSEELFIIFIFSYILIYLERPLFIFPEGLALTKIYPWTILDSLFSQAGRQFQQLMLKEGVMALLQLKFLDASAAVKNGRPGRLLDAIKGKRNRKGNQNWQLGLTFVIF